MTITIVIGEKLYTGDNVQDGFYESVLNLKKKSDDVNHSQYFDDFRSHYSHIIELCRSQVRMDPLTDAEAFKILEKMKPDVLDFFSITPYHYLYAGPAGWRHFTLLLNALISDLSNIDICEVNRAFACILFKGHGRDKTSSRSYRTISSCPVIAKALDVMIRDRNIRQWNLYQAPTQFQGEGSSHELAGILLTECVQYSLHILKRPMFALYLDAQSAFDVVQRELLIKNLFDVNGPSQDLLYVDKRLAARETVVEWNGSLMGPINDEQGLEQGGINSSEFYKIFGKEQLTVAQNSNLGVPLSTANIFAIREADDTVLISNDIHHLFYILQLNKIFCEKYLVKLCAEKTKLQVFKPKANTADDPSS